MYDIKYRCVYAFACLFWKTLNSYHYATCINIRDIVKNNKPCILIRAGVRDVDIF